MHHANLLVGSRSWARSKIPEHEQVLGPDTLLYEYDRMSISDVRRLIHETNLRPEVREYRTFIIMCDSILQEAQNALLKLFEEPNNHTVFFLVVPREDLLLPTLRSRLFLFAYEDTYFDESIFAEFRKKSYAERLAIIQEKHNDEDVALCNAIVKGFASYAHEMGDMRLIRDALFVETYVYTPGSSRKMLLEHIALELV